jgi:hypothetical protein
VQQNSAFRTRGLFAIDLDVARKGTEVYGVRLGSDGEPELAQDQHVVSVVRRSSDGHRIAVIDRAIRSGYSVIRGLHFVEDDPSLNGDKFEHEAALRHLGDALADWKQYAGIRDAHYVPALYNRVGYVNVTELTEKVADDLDIARNWKPGTLKDDGKRAGTEKGFRK